MRPQVRGRTSYEQKHHTWPLPEGSSQSGGEGPARSGGADTCLESSPPCEERAEEPVLAFFDQVKA